MPITTYIIIYLYKIINNDKCNFINVHRENSHDFII